METTPGKADMVWYIMVGSFVKHIRHVDPRAMSLNNVVEEERERIVGCIRIRASVGDHHRLAASKRGWWAWTGTGVEAQEVRAK